MTVLSSLVHSAVRFPLRAVPKGTVIPVLSGQLRGVRWVVGTGTHGCWLGTYEPLTRKWLSSLLAPGGVAFDIGANAGFFTLLASRCVGDIGSVVAFEPLASNVANLRRHLELNRVRNVRVLQVAVSDRGGTGRFHCAENPAMGSLSVDGSLEVETVNLDDLVTARLVPAPDLLKIDVEGAEVRVLKGGLRFLAEKRPAILLSAHGWHLFDESRKLLDSIGYEPEVAKDGSEDGDYLLVARNRSR